jgi:hypothetical protein
MTNTLVFPDGVRLPYREEIPGSESERAIEWARIQSANISQGFVLKHVDGERFKYYAEANVNGPAVFAVFRDLCRALLASQATLVFGDTDDDPHLVGSADVSTIIDALHHHEYQLAHDGFLQFGVASDQAGVLNEVFVAPTKHLNIWLNDEMRFRSIMESHGIEETVQLEFLDEYPTTTIILPADKAPYQDILRLAERLKSELGVPNAT